MKILHVVHDFLPRHSAGTELYVLDDGSLKKGHFQCLSCGTESLVIKAS